MAKRDHGIDSYRAARGDETRGRGDQTEQNHDSQQRDGIEARDLEQRQLIAQQPAHAQAGEDSDGDAHPD